MQELGCRNGEYIMETLAWRCILQGEMCSGQLSMELWRSGQAKVGDMNLGVLYRQMGCGYGCYIYSVL